MTTDQKVIAGIVSLTLIIVIGGTWLSSKKGEKNLEKLSKQMM